MSDYRNPCRLPITDLESKYGLEVPGGISIPPGWNLIVDEAIEKLSKLPGWHHTKIWQIKTKFDTLRIYVGVLEGSAEIIEEAELRAIDTCPVCGLEAHPNKKYCINLNQPE
jgi:hypothetical protein